MTTTADPDETPHPRPPPPSRRERRRRRRAAVHGTKPIDRFNRAALTICGLALITLGALGLLADTSTVSWRSPGHIYRDIARNAADHPGPWVAAAVALGAVLVVFGLWWAWKQVAPGAERGRLSTIVLARTPRGHTTLEPAALAKATANDLAQLDGVTNARVRLVSLDPIPDMIAWLDLRLDADPTAIQDGLEQPLRRLTHALDTSAVDCDLRLRFGTQHAPRVR